MSTLTSPQDANASRIAEHVYHPGRELGQREWLDSRYICALADDDRHLGHIVKTEQWHAYDATHFDEASCGFKYLGAFEERADAKMVVETSVAQKSRGKVFRAGVGASEWQT